MGERNKSLKEDLSVTGEISPYDSRLQLAAKMLVKGTFGRQELRDDANQIRHEMAVYDTDVRDTLRDAAGQHLAPSENSAPAAAQPVIEHHDF